MVFFSSAAALLGNRPGQLCGGQCLPRWAGALPAAAGVAGVEHQLGGMGRGLGWPRGHARRAGRRSTDPPQVGMAALAHLLAAARPDLGVVPIDWTPVAGAAVLPTLLGQLCHAARPRLPRHAALVENWRACPSVGGWPSCAPSVKQAVGRVLGMTELPGPTTGFAELGMDSLMALELRRQLERICTVRCRRPSPLNIPPSMRWRRYLLDEVLALASASRGAAEPHAASGRCGAGRTDCGDQHGLSFPWCRYAGSILATVARRAWIW